MRPLTRISSHRRAQRSVAHSTCTMPEHFRALTCMAVLLQVLCTHDVHPRPPEVHNCNKFFMLGAIKHQHDPIMMIIVQGAFEQKQRKRMQHIGAHTQCECCTCVICGMLTAMHGRCHIQHTWCALGDPDFHRIIFTRSVCAPPPSVYGLLLMAAPESQRCQAPLPSMK
ncbi:hypothetical protein BC834DRAFT_915930 [Gloeopeniophorella convolvens]|nr:hypothetical protein BC834DRAFT_915930 [Gloeopeniophorella convolvens]